MRRLLPLMAVLAPLPAAGAEPETPGLEMLEYLGQWQSEDEEEKGWVDPVGMVRAGLLAGGELAPVSTREPPKEEPGSR